MRSSAALLVLSVLAAPALAATPLVAITVSPDITVNVGGAFVVDEDTAIDDLVGPVIAGGTVLSSDVDLQGFHDLGTSVLLAVDVPTDLVGTFVAPGEVAELDVGTGAVTSRFDPVAAGLPAGTRVDAVTVNDAGELLVSFDTTVAIGGVTADDEDLVRVEGAGSPAIVFDGSALGVDPALDLDGAHALWGSGNLLVSFDGSGSVGGVSFDDEDVLEYSPGGATWDIAYDASAEHPADGLEPSDVNALFAEGDLDGDGVPDGDDNCPTVANADQADIGETNAGGAADGVGDACDICLDINNPRVASPPSYLTIVNGQRDGNGNGFGNKCDGKIIAGAAVGGGDTTEFRASFLVPIENPPGVANATCGTTGSRNCDQFDMDEVGASISGADTSANRARFLLVPGPGGTAGAPIVGAGGAGASASVLTCVGPCCPAVQGVDTSRPPECQP